MKNYCALIVCFIVASVLSCRTSQDSFLKDDILATTGSDTFLYWHAGSGSSSVICRARCDTTKLVINGNLAETRNSCDKSSAQSISSSLVENTPNLKGLMTIFRLPEPLSPNGVAQIHEKEASGKEKDVASKSSQLNALFTDENMYLNPKMAQLREQGLVAFGVQELNRFHPSCYSTAPQGNSVGIEKQVVKTVVASAPPTSGEQAVFKSKQSVKVPAMVYYGLSDKLAVFSGQARSHDVTISTTLSQGETLLWFKRGDKKLKVNLTSGNRGPQIENSSGDPIEILSVQKDQNSHEFWTMLLKAIAKIELKQFGVQLEVQAIEGSQTGYKTIIAETEGNFSSPGDVTFTTSKVSFWEDRDKNAFFVQIEKIK